MNYYEELGVSPAASIEEIRQAYRRLARVLHPDNQSEESLRSVAELQMRRLNGILETLVDPQRRLVYDKALTMNGELLTPSAIRSAEVPPPAASIGMRDALEYGVRHWFSLLLGAILVGLGIWYLSTPPRPQIAPATMPAPPVQTEAQSGPISPVPDHKRHRTVSARAPVSHSHQTLPEPPDLSPPIEPRVVAQPLLAKISPPPPEPFHPVTRDVPAPAPVAEAKSATPQPDSFAGNWLYVPRPREPGDESLYPPEYVELLMKRQGDKLAGEYRARYKIKNAPLSPEVRFQIEGEPSKDSRLRLAWKSAQGAAGEIELVLRGPDSLNVTWWTTKSVSLNSLSSGTCLLIRQKER